MFHHFELTSAPGTGASGKRLLMDGEPLRGVRAVTVRTSVDEAPTVSVEFVTDAITFDGDADLIDVTEIGDNVKKYARRG